MRPTSISPLAVLPRIWAGPQQTLNGAVLVSDPCRLWLIKARSECMQVRNGEAPLPCLEEQRINSNSSAKARAKLSNLGLLEVVVVGALLREWAFLLLSHWKNKRGLFQRCPERNHKKTVFGKSVPLASLAYCHWQIDIFGKWNRLSVYLFTYLFSH